MAYLRSVFSKKLKNRKTNQTRLKPDARTVITRLVNLAAEAGVIDPDTGRPLPLITSTISEKTVSLTAAAVAEFKTQPHTPEPVYTYQVCELIIPIVRILIYS